MLEVLGGVPGSARTRRDGFDGVKPSGYDNHARLGHREGWVETINGISKRWSSCWCWRPPQAVAFDCFVADAGTVAHVEYAMMRMDTLSDASLHSQHHMNPLQ
jgi:hypothetical protein